MSEQVVDILGLSDADPRFRALFDELAAADPPERYVIEDRQTTNFRGHGVSLDISEGTIVSWCFYLAQASKWTLYSGSLPLAVEREWSAPEVIERLGMPLRDTTLHQRRLQYPLGPDAYVWFVFSRSGEMTRVQAATRRPCHTWRSARDPAHSPRQSLPDCRERPRWTTSLPS